MKPKIGQITTVYGKPCRIIKIRDFGTIDVETLDGKKAYRITGLYWNDDIQDYDDEPENMSDITGIAGYDAGEFYK